MSFSIQFSGTWPDTGAPYSGDITLNFDDMTASGHFTSDGGNYTHFQLNENGGHSDDPSEQMYVLSTANQDGQAAIYFTGQSPTLLSAIVEGYISGGNQQSNIVNDQPANNAAPCFVSGTLIATDRGPIRVENLRPGDRVVTASGGHRPVAWTGQRRISPARYPRPAEVQPIRIAADAFGSGLPARDLRVSPGHNIAFAGHLMPASALVNGVTVVQEAVERVTYWHVELDAHDILLAEGLPTESYLDTGNRSTFAQGTVSTLHGEIDPRPQPRHWSETCLPLVKQGPAVERAKTALLARIAELGHATTAEPDLHVLADGMRIDPIRLGPRRFAFVLPEMGGEAALCSRSFAPRHMCAASHDGRTLGVALGRIQIDGDEADLGALPGVGWSYLESNGSSRWRWTTGQARLPAGCRMVVVDLCGIGLYRVAPEAAPLRIVA